jgi:RNA polymerase sigma-70 factor (ECF subfamily)
MSNPASHAELEQLVLRCQQQDVRAFESLLRELQPGATRLARSIVRSQSEAEEVVQEAFLRVWKGIAGLRDSKQVRAWSYGVVRNVALSRLPRLLRWRARTTSDGDSAWWHHDVVADRQSPEEILQRRELSELVRHEIGQLKEKHRTVLMLRMVDEMSYAEIAEVVGCPQGTVESRVHRAKDQLARRLRRATAQGGSKR